MRRQAASFWPDRRRRRRTQEDAGCLKKLADLATQSAPLETQTGLRALGCGRLRGVCGGGVFRWRAYARDGAGRSSYRLAEPGGVASEVLAAGSRIYTGQSGC